ncbi:MAG: hypothetical protein E7518_00085 [Ruminococcaceae bacterium]|nr:hypothetical protein [Oscillospiraceae bacterium]
MAKITDLQKCARPVRVTGKTVLEYNFDQRYFSMWVHASGQEGGMEKCPPSIQLDAEMAKRLCGYLQEFIHQSDLKNT